ncbi:DNA adenine methylase [Pantoea dispersa]|uniref:DNA adenine methylase n=1 Tax=Pantoea TaxID=53335 RepID=UPI0039BE2699
MVLGIYITRRIRRTQIENLSWEDVLSRYDRTGTLFYLDPPYVPETMVSGGYEHEMTLDDPCPDG